MYTLLVLPRFPESMVPSFASQGNDDHQTTDPDFQNAHIRNRTLCKQVPTPYALFSQKQGSRFTKPSKCISIVQGNLSLQCTFNEMPSLVNSYLQ